jgi:hypothetical protein
MAAALRCTTMRKYNPPSLEIVFNIEESMRKCAELFTKLILVLCLVTGLHAQGMEAPADQSQQHRVVIGGSGSSADSVIAVAPDTSWTTSISFEAASPIKPVDPSTLAAWLKQESAINGLSASDVHPWHIVIAYDQFDGDGDNFNSGVLEELWAGPKKFKRTYKSDNLNQTDYGTNSGLFRLGDQRWPNRAELQVRNEVIDPFSYAKSLKGVLPANVERKFGMYTLNCFVMKNGSGGISIPAQYCFEDNGSRLRYARGFGWFQTAFNDIVSFQERNVGRDVEVTDGGKPYLKLHVKTIEAIETIDDKDFVPPDNAINLSGQRVTGVVVKAIKQPFPDWPSALRREHFKVEVQIVIGKDGHVVSAHAVAGPSDAYKAAEDTVRKWAFLPYLVLGEPVEVESKVQLQNN